MIREKSEWRSGQVDMSGAMIPKTIHYCWFGKGLKSDLNKRCMDTWRRVMPDYQIKEWNETNYPLDTAYSQRAHAKEFWSKLSNLARLHVVITEGGIYLDTDVEVLKTFSPLLHHQCFLGFQVKEAQVDWVNNGVLGAQAGHPFLKRCRELTLERFANTGEFYRSPAITTIVLKEMGLKEYGLQEIEGVTIYPREYFYPYSWTEKFSPECIKENTCSIHHGEGTWLKKELLLNRFSLLERVSVSRHVGIATGSNCNVDDRIPSLSLRVLTLDSS